MHKRRLDHPTANRAPIVWMVRALAVWIGLWAGPARAADRPSAKPAPVRLPSVELPSQWAELVTPIVLQSPSLESPAPLRFMPLLGEDFHVFAPLTDAEVDLGLQRAANPRVGGWIGVGYGRGGFGQ